MLMSPRRCTPEQKVIFYLCAPTRELAKASPYFEAFKSSGREVSPPLKQSRIPPPPPPPFPTRVFGCDPARQYPYNLYPWEFEVELAPMTTNKQI